MRRALIILSLCLPFGAGAQTWAENTTFDVGATPVNVRFGADQKWVMKPVSGLVPCNVSVFTDPNPGVVKTCVVDPVKVPPPVAHTPCTLPTPGKFVVSVNARGAWFGMWCGPNLVHIVACEKASCNSRIIQVLFAQWVEYPSVEGLTIGPNPINDPKLREVWVPEWSKLAAIRPK